MTESGNYREKELLWRLKKYENYLNGQIESYQAAKEHLYKEFPELKDLKMPRLEDLQLNTRMRNALASKNIETLEDLLNKTPKDFLFTKNVGKTSLRHLQEELAKYGLRLRNDLENPYIKE